MVCALGLLIGFALTAPAFAQQPKESKPKVRTIVPKPQRTKIPYWGTDKFPAGPIYNRADYLGDDPDPNIRFQIQRDLGLRYGGES